MAPIGANLNNVSGSLEVLVRAAGTLRGKQARLSDRVERAGPEMKLAGEDAAQLLARIKELADKTPGQGEPVKLLECVWNEHLSWIRSAPCSSGIPNPWRGP